jgi:hypothetical protein
VVSEGGLEPPRPCGHQPLKLDLAPGEGSAFRVFPAHSVTTRHAPTHLTMSLFNGCSTVATDSPGTIGRHPVQNTHQKVGQEDDFRSLSRIFELHVPVTGRIFEHAYGAGEQLHSGGPLAGVEILISERAIVAEGIVHESYTDR